MLPDGVLKQAEKVIALYRAKSCKIALAESCTGGMVSSALTSVAGSSAVFEYGFVTYANAAKVKLLGLSPTLLRKYGAVSAECATAMARHARQIANADVGLAITGIAGPTGGSKAKPVGLVYIALTHGKKLQVKRFVFKGSRAQVRQQR